jgi:hypothetical protein
LRLQVELSGTDIDQAEPAVAGSNLVIPDTLIAARSGRDARVDKGLGLSGLPASRPVAPPAWTRWLALSRSGPCLSWQRPHAQAGQADERATGKDGDRESDKNGTKDKDGMHDRFSRFGKSRVLLSALAVWNDRGMS